jgi:hypothetical protein
MRDLKHSSSSSVQRAEWVTRLQHLHSSFVQLTARFVKNENEFNKIKLLLKA